MEALGNGVSVLLGRRIETPAEGCSERVRASAPLRVFRLPVCLQYLTEFPLGPWVTPQDVAQTGLELCPPASASCTIMLTLGMFLNISLASNLQTGHEQKRFMCCLFSEAACKLRSQCFHAGV